MVQRSDVVITGGAGYIGSRLSGELLRRGRRVTVLDALLFGGESLLGYVGHPDFAFRKVDVADEGTDLRRYLEGAELVFHLAAIVGFPACQQVGEQIAWRYNVEATRRVFEAAQAVGVRRLIFASTYSNYGVGDGSAPVTESSPLRPQSLYARTKIAAEEYLLQQGRSSSCAIVIPRFATLYGVSPRTRFDLIVNQFVLEALIRRKLVLYQGDYTRSFIHIADVVEALVQMGEAADELIRNEIFNVAASDGNYAKHEVVDLVRRQVPGVKVEYRQLSFGGDMRDVAVSAEKIGRVLGFQARRSLEQGIREIREVIETGLIRDPLSSRYRNHEFIVT
jgi:nucleoside-diphosphate-sugar epimerase